MWATSVPILVFLGLSVLDLGPMYATDRQTDVRQKHRLMPPPYGAGYNNGRTKLSPAATATALTAGLRTVVESQSNRTLTTRGIDHGVGGPDPLKYVGGVRVCFDP